MIARDVWGVDGSGAAKDVIWLTKTMTQLGGSCNPRLTQLGHSCNPRLTQLMGSCSYVDFYIQRTGGEKGSPRRGTVRTLPAVLELLRPRCDPGLETRTTADLEIGGTKPAVRIRRSAAYGTVKGRSPSVGNRPVGALTAEGCARNM